MRLSKPQELSLASGLCLSTLAANSDRKTKPDIASFFMRTSSYSLGSLRSVSVSFSDTHNCWHRCCRISRSHNVSSISFPKPHKFFTSSKRCAGTSASVEQLVGLKRASEEEDVGAFHADQAVEAFYFDKSCASLDVKHLPVPDLEVKELQELPEQWRRARLAWLCKHLSVHKSGTRILNEHKKWMTQEDAAYVAVYCIRIRENESAFKVYKWMMQQKRYQFDFALATKLADSLGKERRFAKCREIFDDIINQGHVPSESTFHVLIIAYLSSSIEGCLEEACDIYNRMILLGGYQPRLSLHNSLFRALVIKPGISSKRYLKQAEFVFHNLVTTGHEIHKDVYGGLIWLHSYQDTVDKERITSLRQEMQQAGIGESREVLLSVLLSCSKDGDVDEAERTWLKLLHSDGGLPSLAFVYKMEVYSVVGKLMEALDVFREMKELLGTPSLAAYNKIIEIMSKSQEVQLAESLMTDAINSNLKPLAPAYFHLMNMYFNLSLHDKLEMTFSECLVKCQPNRSIYVVYLDSLVKVGNLQKAEEVFDLMHNNAPIGIDGRSCNIILSGYLSSGDYVKAEKIYNMMCMKQYDIETPSMEKLEYVLSLIRKTVRRPVSLKLSKEQREILVGLLLGCLRIESDDQRKAHVIHFNFNEKSDIHSLLTSHIHDQFNEWLHPSCRQSDASEDIPYKFCTTAQSQFSFYADQFWPKGCPRIPSLIHRWLSPRVLAYWYMYGGRRSSAGDILLKLNGTHEGVERIVESLKAKSIYCKVKSKGRFFGVGVTGKNATWFWKLVEPYILKDLKPLLGLADPTVRNSLVEAHDINFDSGSDSDEKAGFHTDDHHR